MVLCRHPSTRALRRLGALWVFVAVVARLAAQADQVPGTLPEDVLPGLRSILEIALQRSPQLLSAEFERTLAEARVDGANAPRLPSVGGNLNYANNQTAISSNTDSQTRDNGLFYNIGVTQALFHWRALKNQSDSARINALIARKSLDLAARELAVLMRRMYLALIVEKTRLAAASESLRLMRADLAVTEEKKAKGTVSSAAVEGDKLRIREVQLDCDRLAAEFEANLRRFARLAGVPGLKAEDVPDTLPALPFSPDLAAALSAAVLRDGAKSTLEYEINELRVRDSLLRHAIEKVRLYPKFYANAGYSLENSTNVNSGVVNQQGIQRRTVSVYAQWSIFDGFATRGVLKEAIATRRMQERRLAIDTESVLQNVQILERTLRLDAEQQALAEIRESLAIEGTRIVGREVEFGNVPKADLDRARAQVLHARIKTHEARATLYGRWSEFVAVTGADPTLRQLSSRHAREKP
ncbi:MAG: TolC family protein [Verrucomicrobia bacterium]|nr:TolC family protein [Verrucomicrobiota bacterium]